MFLILNLKKFILLWEPKKLSVYLICYKILFDINIFDIDLMQLTLFSASVPAKPGEEEGNLDSLAVSVVEKSLEIFNLISNVFKTSTRAGGHVSLFTKNVSTLPGCTLYNPIEFV